ncbi:MAG: hypothetical protein RLZZ64_1278, partial [Bacteroidota bacterium]
VYEFYVLVNPCSNSEQHQDAYYRYRYRFEYLQ